MVELDTSEALAACLARSEAEPVFIFKHSTRCPISSEARAEVGAYLEEAGARPVYINYVVECRPISNEIAQVLGIRHESPQIVLVSSGKRVWNASHGSVLADAMVEASRRAQNQ